MQIDYALILSAGLGTRMGEIGKLIPKVLWPVYFKTLLELQINYCEDLGIKKIYINTHFLHAEIALFLKKSNLLNRITILHEDPLLDSGGAIHNLAMQAEVNYKGNALLVNGDQFLFFDKKYWDEALSRIKNRNAVLFGITVDKNSVYNETVLANNLLVEIRKNTAKDKDYVTYSGLGLINLDRLKPCPGVSRFFETVANYKIDEIELVTPEAFEYWDFGTSDIYFKNIFKLHNQMERESSMGKFLSKHSAFTGTEDLFLSVSHNALDLECGGHFSPNSICAKKIVQKI